MLGTFDRLVLDLDLALVQEVLGVAADRVDRSEPFSPRFTTAIVAAVDVEPTRLALGDL